MTQLLYALQSAPLDAGSEHFGPSSLEVVSVDVGNPAWNVIPAHASARFNSRYNDRWTRESLEAEISGGSDAAAADPALSAKLPIRWRLEPEPPCSDVFLTRDEALIGMVSDADREGRPAAARRCRRAAAPPTRASSRIIARSSSSVRSARPCTRVDEHVPLAEIEATAAIYEELLERLFPAMIGGLQSIRDNLAGAFEVMLGRPEG